MDYKFAMHSRCCMAHTELAINEEGELQLVCEKCGKPVPELKIEGEAPRRSTCCGSAYEALYLEDETFVLSCAECGNKIEGITVEGPDLSHHECECCGSSHKLDFEEMIERSKMDLMETIAEGKKFVHKVVGLRGLTIANIWPVFITDEDKADVFLAIGTALSAEGCDGACVVIDTNLSSKGEDEHESDSLVVMYLDFRDLSKIQTRMVSYEVKGTRVSFMTEDTEDMDEFGGMIPGQIMCGYAYRTIALKISEGMKKENAIKTFKKEFFKGIEKFPDLKKGFELSVGSI